MELWRPPNIFIDKKRKMVWYATAYFETGTLWVSQSIRTSYWRLIHHSLKWPCYIRYTLLKITPSKCLQLSPNYNVQTLRPALVPCDKPYYKNLLCIEITLLNFNVSFKGRVSLPTQICSNETNLHQWNKCQLTVTAYFDTGIYGLSQGICISYIQLMPNSWKWPS